MEKQQKSNAARGKPRATEIERDVVRPGEKPREPDRSGGDVRNPGPAPGKSRDPLAHPGDEQDITPDVIAGHTQPSSVGSSNTKP